MNEITPHVASLVPDSGTIQEEIDAINRDVRLSGLLKETVYYRLYRIHRNKTWADYADPDTGEMYQTFEAFLQDTMSHLNLGRQTIFNRIKLYDQMIWLGYDDNQAIHKIAEKPELYRNVLNLCIDWDSKSKQPNAIKLPALTGATTGEAKAYLLGIIENAESFDTQMDGLEYIKDDLLYEPRFKAWIDDMSQIITVEYSTQSVDGNGRTYLDESGTIKMYPDKPLPSWVLNKLRDKLR